MGYTTDFQGCFYLGREATKERREPLDRQLDDATKALLHGLANTRRMKRCIFKLAQMGRMSVDLAQKKWGQEGEFYFNFENLGQQHDDPTVLEYNYPPTCQPGLWCQWVYREDEPEGPRIEWNGGEKFYNYALWLKYLIEEILAPKGYVLNGSVSWQGEDRDDRGLLKVVENRISIEPESGQLYNHYRYEMRPQMVPVGLNDF